MIDTGYRVYVSFRRVIPCENTQNQNIFHGYHVRFGFKIFQKYLKYVMFKSIIAGPNSNYFGSYGPLK